jgi:hypothetical protein
VEYNPGKLWDEAVDKWFDGFRRYHNPDTEAILADKEKLEQVMRECLQRHHGYITAGKFARALVKTIIYRWVKEGLVVKIDTNLWQKIQH